MVENQSKEVAELKEKLEEYENEKKGLLKIISHDIRSPFNKIHALIQLMKMDEDNLSGDQLEYLSSMHQTVMNGLELIRNLHDIRMIDEENVSISKEQVDLVTVIRKSISNFEELAAMKKIKLFFKTSLKNAPIKTDDHYLQRAIENLISNAIKFSFGGKPVNMSLDLEDKIYTFQITDYGQGIKAEEVNLLFKRFSKLSSQPTKGENSAGLGLYLAKNFVNKLDGEIFYHNEDKGMTSFVIQLPS